MPSSEYDSTLSLGVTLRPYITAATNHYELNPGAIDRALRGEFDDEVNVLKSYFSVVQERDAAYLEQIQGLVAKRAERLESSGAYPDRRIQMIVPTYRESEHLGLFLEAVDKQFQTTDRRGWGVTFVFNYKIPYVNSREYEEYKTMQKIIHNFLVDRPYLKRHIDTIFYTRAANTDPELHSTSLARKVGEDVIMLERLHAGARLNQYEVAPFYLGLMDADITGLTDGLFGQIESELPDKQNDIPVIVRARGQFDRRDVKDNLYLHPLQMIWEGATAEIARGTGHNPFNIGRLSVVPAREFAMTGGGLPHLLEFTDEDIRRGIQIAWQLRFVNVKEVSSFETSARREKHVMSDLKQMLIDSEGRFDRYALECAALIRMYSVWANETYRGGESIEDAKNEVLTNIHEFQKIVPPQLIEVMANAFYRFTLFSVYAIDELWHSPHAPEIRQLRDQFLKGKIPYFRVQLGVIDFIRHLDQHDHARFESLRPLLEGVDQKARKSMVSILAEHDVVFQVDDSDPLCGIIERGKPDEEGILAKENFIVKAPIRIPANQVLYMHSVREELEV